MLAPALLSLALQLSSSSASCRPCHPSQWIRQQASAHASALRREAEHPLKERFATSVPFVRGAQFRFLFTRNQGSLEVRADDGRYVTALPVEWAFGAGMQAVTFVSRVDASHHLEHAVSYYRRGDRMDLTPRHDQLPARTLQQAMGQALPTRGAGLSITQCFECHSTGPVTVNARGEVQVHEAGVSCEACHGPAAMHLEGEAKMPKMPKAGQEVNALCGRCHRSDRGDFDWNSVWNVRHQPPFLARSKCFTSSSGKLSCLTCHDPHENVRRSEPAYYRARCQSCHAAGQHVQAKTDCAGCHMPAVPAGARLEFHNHWIGVYAGGPALRPQR